MALIRVAATWKTCSRCATTTTIAGARAPTTATRRAQRDPRRAAPSAERSNSPHRRHQFSAGQFRATDHREQALERRGIVGSDEDRAEASLLPSSSAQDYFLWGGPPIHCTLVSARGGSFVHVSPSTAARADSSVNKPCAIPSVGACSYIEKSFRYELFQSLRTSSVGVVRALRWGEHVAC